MGETPVNDGRRLSSREKGGNETTMDDSHTCFFLNNFAGLFHSCLLGAALPNHKHNKRSALIQVEASSEEQRDANEGGRDGEIYNHHGDTLGVNLVDGSSTHGSTSIQRATSLSTSVGDVDNNHDVIQSSLSVSPTANGMQLLGPSSSALLSNLQLRVVPWHREQAWEDLEDDLCLILAGQTDCLSHFQRLHKEGLVQSNLLRSLAHLVSRPDTGTRSTTVPGYPPITTMPWPLPSSLLLNRFSATSNLPLCEH
jgi:hypothetical protein